MCCVWTACINTWFFLTIFFKDRLHARTFFDIKIYWIVLLPWMNHWNEMNNNKLLEENHINKFWWYTKHYVFLWAPFGWLLIYICIYWDEYYWTTELFALLKCEFFCFSTRGNQQMACPFWCFGWLFSVTWHMD